MTDHTTKTEKQRTTEQNRALHLFFQNLADTLNDAGLDMKAVLKPNVDIPWTTESVKNHLWRPVQELLLDKKSTTELTTKEVDRVYDVINRHIGEKFGVHVEFPSIESLIDEK